MITVRGLRKRFGKQQVLDGLDLEVERGSVFALLGPNGAGKTTTVHILSTLIHADGGEMTIAGHHLARHPHRVRAAIGVTGQFSAVDAVLTGEENLLLMADLHRLPRRQGRQTVSDLLQRFDLEDARRKVAMRYSGGMRRRLDLAMSLVGRPQVIFLDEPTTGLDPNGRRAMWELIRALAQDGVTIFLTTQYLDEADELADHIAVLDRGRVVAEGSAEELKALVPGGHVSLRFPDPPSLRAAAAMPEVVSTNEGTLEIQVRSDGSVRSVRQILDWLDVHEVPVGDLSIHRPDLDDVFFTLTGAAPAGATRPQELEETRS
ncbi:MAG: ATP-binding cassette domain-containing protein [Candidatus Dormibacteraeota bacterium]|nr:ATP-binding cassette domain-containing protein [Candidatus Dormibacteraeota bacterium]